MHPIKDVERVVDLARMGVMGNFPRALFTIFFLVLAWAFVLWFIGRTVSKSQMSDAAPTAAGIGFRLAYSLVIAYVLIFFFSSSSINYLGRNLTLTFAGAIVPVILLTSSGTIVRTYNQLSSMLNEHPLSPEFKASVALMSGFLILFCGATLGSQLLHGRIPGIDVYVSGSCNPLAKTCPIGITLRGESFWEPSPAATIFFTRIRQSDYTRMSPLRVDFPLRVHDTKHSAPILEDDEEDFDLIVNDDVCANIPAMPAAFLSPYASIEVKGTDKFYKITHRTPLLATWMRPADCCTRSQTFAEPTRSRMSCT